MQFAKTSESNAYSPLPLCSCTRCLFNSLIKMHINKKNLSIKHFAHMHFDAAELSIQLEEIEITTTPPTATAAASAKYRIKEQKKMNIHSRVQ